jgi:GNAT superfamily N-acetyltransferase
MKTMPAALSPVSAQDRAARRATDLFEIEAWSALVAAAPAEFRSHTGLEVRAVGGATCVFAPGIPSTEFNRAVGLGLKEPATPADAEAVVSAFRRRGVAKAWVQLADDAVPAALPDWIAAAGAVSEGPRWRLCAAALPLPSAAPVQTVLRVALVDRASAAEAAAVFVAGYGLPPVFHAWNEHLPLIDEWSGYAAFDGDRIVAVAYLFVRGDRAAMMGAATLPEARGRGAQTALLAHRLAAAAAKGARVAQSHSWVAAAGSRNSSLENMLKAGLAVSHDRRNFVLAAS